MLLTSKVYGEGGEPAHAEHAEHARHQAEQETEVIDAHSLHASCKTHHLKQKLNFCLFEK
jgi:hypothetical protein